MVRKARAPNESSFSIHNQQFSMRTVVNARHALPVKRVVELDIPTCLDQVLEIAHVGGEAADCVQSQIYFDSSAGAFGQSSDKPSGDLTFMKDVRFKIDTPPGPANGLQLSFIKLLAIGMYGEFAAMVDVGVGQGLQRRHESLWIN